MQPTENYETAAIVSSLSENLENIRNIMGNSADLLINEVTLSGIKSALVCCEGMISTSTVTELVLHPLMKISLPEARGGNDIMEHILTNMLMTTDRSVDYDYGKLIRHIMSGFAVILSDGFKGAVALGVQGYDKRSISEPSSEENIRGAHEGFVEVIRTNMSLIRRRMKTASLRFKMFQLGTKSKTDICMAYMTDKAPPELVAAVEKRLKSVKLETVLTAGYLEPFLEDNRPSFFKGAGTTERPDVLCGKLLEGRVAVLVDGTPFVLVVPTLFAENFQTLDDYAFRPPYAAFLRFLRFFAFFLSIFLPGVYVAAATFHPEVFKSDLLITLAEEELSAPFPLAAEAFVVLILFEIIKEAGLRLPKVIGGAVSIVGGLIIGDAAVTSGLVSMPLLLVTALAVTASFLIPALNQSSVLLRLIFLALGGFLGFFGIALGSVAVLLGICSMQDYGIPLTAPISPLTPSALSDIFIRRSFKRAENHVFTLSDLKGTQKEDKN